MIHEIGHISTLAQPDGEEISILERDTSAQDRAFDIKLCGISSTSG